MIGAKLGQVPLSKAYWGGGDGAAIAKSFTRDPLTVELAKKAHAAADKVIKARPKNFAGPGFSHVFVRKFTEEVAKTEGLIIHVSDE